MDQKGVRYENVGHDYLEARQLKKSARWGLLWALGVGAVISGDFFGWNFGLAVGGFWGLAVATLLMAAMYVCMVYSIAELTAALPHAGGFYSFVRNAMGPGWGYLCGVTDTIEYVLTPAVIAIAISGYLNAILFGSAAAAPWWAAYAWWLLAYGIFTGVNLRGVELTLKVGLVITAVAGLVLVTFFAAALGTGAFDPALLDDPKAPALGAAGVFAALPYAIWFFLAIEQLPLSAEEAHDVVRDVPKALLWGIATLLVLALFTLVLNTGVGGGPSGLAASQAPLADGFRAVLGDGLLPKILIVGCLAGLVASFHATIYAYARVLFALSRAGYFPRRISTVNRHQSPQRALIVGAVVGLGAAFLIDQFEGAVGAALLNMAVLGAVISYVLVMVSFIRLRLRRPELPRPYVSPLGVPGAAVGAVLAAVALAACFADPVYRSGVVGTVILVAVGMAYFYFWSRHRLVAQAPEEKIALADHK